MFSKIVALCAVVAVSQAGLLPVGPAQYSSAAAVSSQSIVRHEQPRLAVAAPVYRAPAIAYSAAPAVTYAAVPAITYSAAPVALASHADVQTPAKYEYAYSVADGHTGDNKQQQESRDGDVVKGSYSFQEADGSIRTVEYTADAHNGFNAVVHNTAPKAAPAYVAAPAYTAAVPQYYH